MITSQQIENALHNYAPTELKLQVSHLAAIINAALNGTTLTSNFQSDPDLVKLLSSLSNQSFSVEKSVFSFGSGNNIGDITIRDIAGGNIVNLNLSIAKQQYIVSPVCPLCNTTNTYQSRHCIKCGSRLVRICPECQKETSYVFYGFCSSCGYYYEIALKRHALRNESATLKTQYSNLLSEVKVLENHINQLRIAQTPQTAFPEIPISPVLGINLLVITVAMLILGQFLYFALALIAVIGIILYIIYETVNNQQIKTSASNSRKQKLNSLSLQIKEARGKAEKTRNRIEELRMELETLTRVEHSRLK